MEVTALLLRSLGFAALVAWSPPPEQTPQGIEARAERLDLTLALTGRVVDQAGVLDAASLARIAERARTLEAERGHQLVVVTVSSLGGRTIEAFTRTIANRLGFGRREANDGVVILLAPSERRICIEVGIGLEAVLTISRSAEIIGTVMLPRFREEGYAGGLVAGVDAVVATLSAAGAAQPCDNWPVRNAAAFYLPRPVFDWSASMRSEASALLSLGSKGSPASSQSVCR